MLKNKSQKYPNIASLSGEVGVMIKDFQGQIKLVAEQTAEIPKIKNDLAKLVEDMKTVKSDLELIKYSLKQKVDLDDFHALERRVALLESRR
ncbi:MAG: hypothetical protein A3J46_00920 [Candidatus Yanofskybacteria bacterium RIFCSPHIGHO2_02_FULL_41_11]|uniref:Uncharacterized protein n=1 Tax=Candidatus Yanofskybacteria bacterium RIFCSPHIGHO2_02_FULL_41_11 TaxID=1802675 RepID=A0A1F8F4V3_9BACT|nr:MAG: hypothetical protein A3J46_00920 [Candidatus Yanofskybacteria bacterium RIFCSPHIGHO2_02_FULL_41_11]